MDHLNLSGKRQLPQGFALIHLFTWDHEDPHHLVSKPICPIGDGCRNVGEGFEAWTAIIQRYSKLRYDVGVTGCCLASIHEGFPSISDWTLCAMTHRVTEGNCRSGMRNGTVPLATSRFPGTGGAHGHCHIAEGGRCRCEFVMEECMRDNQ